MLKSEEIKKIFSKGDKAKESCKNVGAEKVERRLKTEGKKVLEK